MKEMTDEEAEYWDEYYTKNTVMPVSSKPGFFARKYGMTIRLDPDITRFLADQAETTQKTPAEIAGKYLTFNLLEEFYGIKVDWLLQIIAIPEITSIPNTPEFIKGVINLRGKILPVVDLRLKFNLPSQEYNERTCIVVIKMDMNGDEVYIGFIIDKVLEVIDIHPNEIEITPTFGTDFDSDFILGMAKVKGKVITLLNISSILAGATLSKIINLHNKRSR